MKKKLLLFTIIPLQFIFFLWITGCNNKPPAMPQVSTSTVHTMGIVNGCDTNCCFGPPFYTEASEEIGPPNLVQCFFTINQLQTLCPTVAATEETATATITPGTPTPTQSPTTTPSGTQTITPSGTQTATASLTQTFTPTETPTITPSGTQTITPSVTETTSSTDTPTQTPTPNTPTFTPTDTFTPVFTSTPTPDLCDGCTDTRDKLIVDLYFESVQGQKNAFAACIACGYQPETCPVCEGIEVIDIAGDAGAVAGIEIGYGECLSDNNCN